MSLAQNYATLLKEVPVENVIEYMKKKGHLPLLPRVMRALLSAKDERAVVAAVDDTSVAALTTRFPDARFVIDSRIVGGYLMRRGAQVIDATYRRALVTMYKAATQSRA